MNACAKCGYDPSAVVKGSWLTTIARDPPSLNARLFNSGSRAHLYRRERDLWAWEFRSMRLALRIPFASSRRRVTFTRCYGGRQQERDVDNFVGGMKNVIDAMVLERLLIDDNSQWAELHYTQQRLESAPKSARGLIVHIEEIA
jgi:hypothetical protein